MMAVIRYGTVDLSDAIIALQVVAGILPVNGVIAADVNNDGKLGMEEAV